MVRLWYPAADGGAGARHGWMRDGAQQSETNFLADHGVPSTQWQLGPDPAQSGVPVRGVSGPFPIVACSPGMISPAGWNTGLAEDLASHGYIVAALNHTHEAWAVRFPDGRVESGKVPFTMPPSEQSDVLVPIRVADTRFLLDQLTALAQGGQIESESQIPKGLAAGLDIARIAMVGDSLGGSTTAQAMHDDRRIRGGVNLDGPIFGSVGVDGLDRPLLMLAGDDPAWTARPGWNANWTNNIGEKVLLRLVGAAHMSFIDQQVVIPQLASAGLLPPGYAESIVGTIDPARSIDLQRTYVRTFLNAVFADADPRSAVNDLAAPEIEVHP